MKNKRLTHFISVLPFIPCMEIPRKNNPTKPPTQNNKQNK